MTTVTTLAPPQQAAPSVGPGSPHRDRPGESSPVPTSPVRSADLRTSPWQSSWFWLIQVLILAAALVRLAIAVRLGLTQTSPVVEYSTLLVFLPLTTLSELAFGLRGAVFSAVWTTILCLPQLIDAAAHALPAAAVAESVQLLLLFGIAIATGSVVERERRRRLRDQHALDEAAHAIAVYRDLFDSNTSPILVIDGDGIVVDANAAAAAAFGPIGTPSALEVQRPTETRVSRPRLIDAVGADAAGEILAALLSSGHGTGDRDVPEGFEADADTGGTVEVPVGGRPTLFRPSSSMLADPDGRPRMQVVLHDVTAERRRRELVESFASQVLLGQEEERKRISQELHDGPLQNVIHLCRQIDSLDGGGDSVNAAADVRRSAELLVTEIRAIARGLRPSTLDDLGLVTSIRQLLGDTASRTGVEVSLGVTGSERRLPPPVELALFRIAQEALSNVERHAAAKSVAVGLDFELGGLRLLVKDDGAGFDPHAAHPTTSPSSLGLPGMRERAALVGATLRVHSSPGSGTSIDVRVPGTVLAGKPG